MVLGGVNLRPTAPELAALRQPRLPPLAVQQQQQDAASTNRAQFVAVNRGQPQTVVVAKPLAVERREPVPVAAVQQRPQARPINQAAQAARPGQQPAPAETGQLRRSGRFSR